MLDKALCMRCFCESCPQYTGSNWNDVSEDLWASDMVFCWPMDGGKRLRPIRQRPPERCPYLVEQLVNVGQNDV